MTNSNELVSYRLFLEKEEIALLNKMRKHSMESSPETGYLLSDKEMIAVKIHTVFHLHIFPRIKI